MTAPFAPVQDSNPDISLQDWLKILHNAARVPADHPRYSEARQVTQMALANIRGLNQTANAADLAPAPPSKTAAAIFGAGQGATSGLADEYIAALVAAHGKRLNPPGESFSQSRERNLGAVRGQMTEARLEHPGVTIAGNIVGSLLNPVSRVLPAPVTVGKGAVTGAVLGGLQGLGEAEGTLGERVPTAGAGAIGGALAGAALGKLLKKLSPLVSNIVNRVKRTAKPGTPAAQIAASQEVAAETAVRAYLQKDRHPPHVIEQLIQTMKQQKTIPTAPGPKVPVATRPGETLTQTAPREFVVTGPAPPLKEGPFPPTIAEMQGLSMAPRPIPDIGRGKTLPYYPRGGKVEQAFGASPKTSPRTPAPDQTAIFVDYIKGATPQDLPQRIQTLRDLGIPLPPDAQAQLMRMLFGGS